MSGYKVTFHGDMGYDMKSDLVGWFLEKKCASYFPIHIILETDYDNCVRIIHLLYIALRDDMIPKPIQYFQYFGRIVRMCTFAVGVVVIHGFLSLGCHISPLMAVPPLLGSGVGLL